MLKAKDENNDPKQQRTTFRGLAASNEKDFFEIKTSFFFFNLRRLPFAQPLISIG